MADRQWNAMGVVVFEEGEEEYNLLGVVVNEDQATATVVPIIQQHARRRR